MNNYGDTNTYLYDDKDCALDKLRFFSTAPNEETCTEETTDTIDIDFTHIPEFIDINPSPSPIIGLSVRVY